MQEKNQESLLEKIKEINKLTIVLQNSEEIASFGIIAKKYLSLLESFGIRSTFSFLSRLQEKR